jgi:hypothetical protein
MIRRHYENGDVKPGLLLKCPLCKLWSYVDDQNIPILLCELIYPFNFSGSGRKGRGHRNTPLKPGYLRFDQGRTTALLAILA